MTVRPHKASAVSENVGNFCRATEHSALCRMATGDSVELGRFRACKARQQLFAPSAYNGCVQKSMGR